MGGEFWLEKINVGEQDMIENTKILQFKCNQDNYGSLVPVETFSDIPFGIKRVYYIYNVENGMRRGYHSHRDLEQALICVRGSVTIHVRTPFEQAEVLLDDPATALYIGPMVWREMYAFTDDAVLLVLASEHYAPSDYIRDYNLYEKEASAYFLKKDVNTSHGSK